MADCRPNLGSRSNLRGLVGQSFGTLWTASEQLGDLRCPSSIDPRLVPERWWRARVANERGGCGRRACSGVSWQRSRHRSPGLSSPTGGGAEAWLNDIALSCQTLKVGSHLFSCELLVLRAKDSAKVWGLFGSRGSGAELGLNAVPADTVCQLQAESLDVRPERRRLPPSSGRSGCSSRPRLELLEPVDAGVPFDSIRLPTGAPMQHHEAVRSTYREGADPWSFTSNATARGPFSDDRMMYPIVVLEGYSSLWAPTSGD